MTIFSGRKSQKNVYLDWNAICAATPKVEVSYSGRLRGLIVRISKEHNLCLGFSHFSELSQGDNEERCQFRAAWLDSMEWLGVRPPPAVKELELKKLYQELFGIPEKGESASVFIGTWGLLFENNGRGSFVPRADLQSILTLCIGMKSSPDVTVKMANARKVSLILSQNLSRDRKEAFEAHMPSEVLQTILQKLAERIADELHALAVLNASNSEWVPLVPLESGLYGIPDRDIIRKRLGSVEQRKLVLRYYYLGQMSDLWRAERMAKQNPDSERFKRHDSDMWDNLHLVGAAYCDIFSCDIATSSYLQNLREELGLPRQLTAEQGWEKFTDALEQAVFAS
jgi:hypothetical protein